MACPINRTAIKIAIWTPLHKFARLYLRNKGIYWQSEKKPLNSNISSTCPYNMVNFGLLSAENLLLAWGTPGNFNGFRVLAALLQRRRLPEANQTLHDAWLSPGLVHCIDILEAVAPYRNFTSCKIQLRPSLAFCYIGSVTTQHSSSRRQPKLVAWYKEWNCGTCECATYIRWVAITLGIGPHSSSLWSPYGIGQTIIFLPSGFFYGRPM